jgi:hypothetical protein
VSRKITVFNNEFNTTGFMSHMKRHRQGLWRRYLDLKTDQQREDFLLTAPSKLVCCVRGVGFVYWMNNNQCDPNIFAFQTKVTVVRL